MLMLTPDRKNKNINAASMVINTDLLASPAIIDSLSSLSLIPASLVNIDCLKDDENNKAKKK